MRRKRVSGATQDPLPRTRIPTLVGSPAVIIGFIASVLPPPDRFPASQHPFKEVNSLEDVLPGVVFKGNYLFLLLALFSGTRNIVGKDLYYRGALMPKLHDLFGKWAWLAGGIIWPLKHVWVWWRFMGDAGALGIVGAYSFGPMGSLPVTMLIHFIPNFGLTWPLIFQAVFGGGSQRFVGVS